MANGQGFGESRGATRFQTGQGSSQEPQRPGVQFASIQKQPNILGTVMSEVINPIATSIAKRGQENTFQNEAKAAQTILGNIQQQLESDSEYTTSRAKRDYNNSLLQAASEGMITSDNFNKLKSFGEQTLGEYDVQDQRMVDGVLIGRNPDTGKYEAMENLGEISAAEYTVTQHMAKTDPGFLAYLNTKSPREQEAVLDSMAPRYARMEQTEMNLAYMKKQKELGILKGEQASKEVKGQLQTGLMDSYRVARDMGVDMAKSGNYSPGEIKAAVRQQVEDTFYDMTADNLQLAGFKSVQEAKEFYNIDGMINSANSLVDGFDQKKATDWQVQYEDAKFRSRLPTSTRALMNNPDFMANFENTLNYIDSSVRSGSVAKVLEETGLDSILPAHKSKQAQESIYKSDIGSDSQQEVNSALRILKNSLNAYAEGSADDILTRGDIMSVEATKKRYQQLKEDEELWPIIPQKVKDNFEERFLMVNEKFGNIERNTNSGWF